MDIGVNFLVENNETIETIRNSGATVSQVKYPDGRRSKLGQG
jgi:hypothetical protein